MIHVERFRLITPGEVKAKTPGWALGRSCSGATKPYFDKLLSIEAKAPTGGGSLPWMASEDDDSPSSSEEESSSGSEEEDLTAKIRKLQAELKAVEAQAVAKSGKKKGKKDKDDGGDKGSKTTKKKKDKRKKKRSSSTDADDKGKKAKSKKPKANKEKAKQKDKEKSKRKADDKDERGKEKKKRRSSSPSGEASEEEPLFGGPRQDDEKGERHKAEGKDRGPFGGGSLEEFRGKRDSDSEDQVFRDAPAQQGVANQLKLVEYSQRHPGRLAARLLLKMSRESALGSVGAEWLSKSKTPPAAVRYLKTVMTPALGAKLNMRSGRELHTLCTILDSLARKRPEEAADIAGQRIKALERSCIEQGWTSAQFLELISPEHPSLLERSEEVFLNKELILEQKVNALVRKEPRGGKGDQKGGKGKGPKGQGGKDPPKGKDKQKEASWGKTLMMTHPRIGENPGRQRTRRMTKKLCAVSGLKIGQRLWKKLERSVRRGLQL